MIRKLITKYNNWKKERELRKKYGKHYEYVMFMAEEHKYGNIPDTQYDISNYNHVYNRINDID